MKAILRLTLLLVSTITFLCVAPRFIKADFDPGHIIDDGVFNNKGAMSPTDIQLFLNSKVQNCDTYHTADTRYSMGSAPPWTCLKDFSENGISAAQIIFNASQAYNINPQVILTVLQKENSLITDTWPYPWQYKTAMGFGCPDSAPCDQLFYGFTNQVNQGANTLRGFADQRTGWTIPYRPGSRYIPFNSQSSCGGNNVNILNGATASLYSYTPYQPNIASLANLYGAGDSCSSYGNRNFWRDFTNWFGTTHVPSVITGPDGGAVYLIVNDHKVSLPSMALLQDYGYNPQTITSVSQSQLDSIPNPTDPGLSSGLSYLVKSPSDTDEDGGTVYLISVGKRYAITSMNQLSSFGVDIGNISFLPLTFIKSIPDGGKLSNFIFSPSSRVFKIQSAQKNLIFDFDTYKALNPSQVATPVSDGFLTTIVSGSPLSNREILVRTSNSAVYLFKNNAYFTIPSMDVYHCWGFGSVQSTPMFALSDNSIISPINSTETLTCLLRDVDGLSYLLNENSRILIPTQLGLVASDITNSSAQQIGIQLPKLAKPLSQAIKSLNGAGVWFVDNSLLRPVPSLNTLKLLGFSPENVQPLNPSVIPTLKLGSLKLADSEIVKGDTTNAVYVVSNNKRYSFSDASLFLAFGNAWNDVETFPTTELDFSYPNSGQIISPFLLDNQTGLTYLIGTDRCFLLSTTDLNDFSTTSSAISVKQNYNSSMFKKINLQSCIGATRYIKIFDQDTVYLLANGVVHPFSNWQALIDSGGGTQPVLMNTSPLALTNLSVGSPITQ